jgi:hypothetical protein
LGASLCVAFKRIYLANILSLLVFQIWNGDQNPSDEIEHHFETKLLILLRNCTRSLPPWARTIELRFYGYYNLDSVNETAMTSSPIIEKHCYRKIFVFDTAKLFCLSLFRKGRSTWSIVSTCPSRSPKMSLLVYQGGTEVSSASTVD